MKKKMSGLLKKIIGVCLSAALMGCSGDGAWAALSAGESARAVTHFSFSEQAIVQRLASQTLHESRSHRPSMGLLSIRFAGRTLLMGGLPVALAGGMAYLWTLAQQVVITPIAAAAAPWHNVIIKLPEIKIIDEAHRTLWSLFGSDALRIAKLNHLDPLQMHIGDAVRTGKEFVRTLSVPDAPALPDHTFVYQHPFLHTVFHYLQDPTTWLVVAALAVTGWMAWLIVKRWRWRRVISAALLASWIPALAQQAVTPLELADMGAARAYNLVMQKNGTQKAIQARDDFGNGLGLDFGFATIFESNPAVRAVGATISGTFPIYGDPTADYKTKVKEIEKLRRAQQARQVALNKRREISDAVILYYGTEKKVQWLLQALHGAEVAARESAAAARVNLIQALAQEGLDYRASLSSQLAVARQESQRALNALRTLALPKPGSKVSLTADSVSPAGLQALLRRDEAPAPEAVLAALSAAGSLEHIQGVYGLSVRSWLERKFPRQFTLSAGLSIQHADHWLYGMWSLIGVQPVWDKFEKHDWDNALREADGAAVLMQQTRDAITNMVITASRTRQEKLALAASASAVARAALDSPALRQTAADRAAEAAACETEAARQELILLSWGLAADDSEEMIATKIGNHFAKAVLIAKIPERIKSLNDFIALHAKGSQKEKAKPVARRLNAIVAWSESDVKIPKAPADPESGILAVILDLVNGYFTNNTTSTAPYAFTIEGRAPGSGTPLAPTGQIAGHVTVSPNAGRMKTRKAALSTAQGVAEAKKAVVAEQNGFWQTLAVVQGDVVYLKQLQQGLQLAGSNLDSEWLATPEGRTAQAELRYQQTKVAIEFRAKMAEAVPPTKPLNPAADREAFNADLEVARQADALSNKALRSITFNGWEQSSQHLYYAAVSPNIKDLMVPVIEYMLHSRGPAATFEMQKVLFVAADHMRSLQAGLKTLAQIDQLNSAWVQAAEERLTAAKQLPGTDPQTPLRILSAEQDLAAARHAQATDQLRKRRLEVERDDWNTWSEKNSGHPLSLLWGASESPAAEPLQVKLAQLELERIKAKRPAITAGGDVTGGPFAAGTASYASPKPTRYWGGQGGFTLDWDKRHKENENFVTSLRAAEQALKDAQKAAQTVVVPSELKALAGFEEALMEMEKSLDGAAPPQAPGLLKVALAQTRQVKAEKANEAGVPVSEIPRLSPTDTVAVSRFQNPAAVANVLAHVPPAPAPPGTRTFPLPIHTASASGFLTKFKNKGISIAFTVYHLVLKGGREKVNSKASEEEGKLANLEKEQKELEYGTLLANLDDLILTDQAALEAASGAQTSAENQWAQLVADAKAGLREMDDPLWETITRNRIEARKAYAAARENLDRDQSMVEALSTQAEGLVLTTESIRPPVFVAATVTRDAREIMELNGVKKLAAQVAGTTADPWVLNQLLGVVREEGKELGFEQWNQLADMAATVDLARPAKNSRRDKVAAFRENLAYAIAFLRENIYLDEQNGGPHLESASALRRLVDGDFELQKRFKDVMAQTRGLQDHGRQWVANGWFPSLQAWNFWALDQAAQNGWARPIVESIADLIQTPEALAAVVHLHQTLEPDSALFPFLQKMGEIHLAGTLEHHSGPNAKPGFKHDAKLVLAMLEKVRLAKNLDVLAEPFPEGAPVTTAAIDAAEAALQTIVVSAPSGGLWTSGHLVEHLRQQSPILADYLSGPLFTRHGAVERFWEAVFGGEGGSPRRRSNRRRTVYVKETIDLAPLWKKALRLRAAA